MFRSSTTPVDGLLRYDEGIHIGYRAWLRAGVAPAYPFGHGLGYTDWQLRVVDNASTTAVGESVAVTVTLANTGSRRGRHVVQVYLSRESSAVERPRRWLAGFAPVTADAGEQVEVTVTLPARAFEHYDSGWGTEPGQFEIHVGVSVSDTPLSSQIMVG